jgi:endonuclease/exonuclease/phosphatase (EEP) superfamily protein YafD
VVASVPSTPLFKLLSFNVLQSNLGSGRKLAAYIEGSGADVVLVMEAGPVKPFAAEISKVYPYNSGCAPRGACDMFWLSKTPLTDIGIASMSRVWENRLITAKTVIGEQTLNLVGAHMVKPYFDDSAVEEAWRIGGYIRSTEGPLVLAGDFNSAAWSQNIDRMARVQHLIPPPYYPATWPVKLGPLGVPIDNMWTRGPLIISSIHALDDALGSNHRGIFAELSLAQMPAAPAAD